MITDEQAQKLLQVVHSSGWNELIVPTIENRGRQAVKALTLSRTERAGIFAKTDFDTDDDVLRAIIKDCAWMTSFFVNELNAWNMNRRNDELMRSESNGEPAGANHQ